MAEAQAVRGFCWAGGPALGRDCSVLRIQEQVCAGFRGGVEQQDQGYSAPCLWLQGPRILPAKGFDLYASAPGLQKTPGNHPLVTAMSLNNIPVNWINRNDVIDCLKQNIENISLLYLVLPESIRSEKDVIHVLSEYPTTATNLELIPEKFKDDKRMVKDFVAQNGINIRYASKRLQDDRTIVAIAVQNNPCSILWASDRLKKDAELIRSINMVNCEDEYSEDGGY